MSSSPFKKIVFTSLWDASSYLSTFCLLLVSEIKWKSDFYSCGENKRGLAFAMPLIYWGKNFAIRVKAKTHRILCLIVEFLINYMYTCEVGDLISANCKPHKTNAAGWLIFGNKPGCCAVIIASVTTSCLSKKDYKSWVPELRHRATRSRLKVCYKSRCSRRLGGFCCCIYDIEVSFSNRF